MRNGYVKKFGMLTEYIIIIISFFYLYVIILIEVSCCDINKWFYSSHCVAE